MGHGHHHHHSDGPRDEAFWDQLWSRKPMWRREPHELVARSVDRLRPGNALDVGCGEGSEAIWLASRGWEVTAVDISRVALDRARLADSEQRVTWLQADVTSWRPPVDAYDLVVAQFLHVHPRDRPSFFDGLARAVRVGGILVFSAHAPPDSATTIHRSAVADLYFTPDEVAQALRPGRWELLVAAADARVVDTHDGPRTDRDTAVHARRVA